MRWCEPLLAVVGALLLLLSTTAHGGSLRLVHQQQYSMGTMFDVVVYHESRAEAGRAVGRAMAEIARLDRVLSHFDSGSELSALVRRARNGATTIGPDLYGVIGTSLEFSRLSGGTFDVTIAPLVKARGRAREEGRGLTTVDRSAAQACVGYEKIELIPPDRIRFASDCVDIDLGGIGKGFAVDRALGLLRAAGIEHAVVNAGGSSIAATGAPPARDGWPVRLGTMPGAARVVTLRDGSVSTSEQHPAGAPGSDIVHPQADTRAHGLAVSVFAPTATASDALSTTLVLLPMGDGERLLERLDDVSAVWLTSAGEVAASFRAPGARTLAVP